MRLAVADVLGMDGVGKVKAMRDMGVTRASMDVFRSTAGFVDAPCETGSFSIAIRELEWDSLVFLTST